MERGGRREGGLAMPDRTVELTGARTNPLSTTGVVRQAKEIG